MPLHSVTEPTPTVVPATLTRYHRVVRAAAETLGSRRSRPGDAELAFRVPEIDDGLREFYAASDVSVHELEPVGGRRVTALNLMRNPGTRTTKTFASLSMVARAVQHIRETGENVIIVTPTSGNKGTALRDAVARAYATGIAGPERLRVMTVAPADSLRKLRNCPLAATPELRAANPAVLAQVDQPAQVKAVTRNVVDAYLADPAVKDTWRVWYTMDLDNYRMADVVRACVEAEFTAPHETGVPRWHAHAVSSAYGLLGYSLGYQLLSQGVAADLKAPPAHPGFFLVQHLSTPDMVLSLSGARLPRYTHDVADGLWRQSADPRFPAVTDSPSDLIDPTFYTRAPVTCAEIDPLIRTHGGDGVVVSQHECLQRYSRVRELAAPLGADLPACPEDLREWSLVMALTGLLVGDERGLIPKGTDVVVHASGSYCDDTLPPAAPDGIRFAAGEEEVLKILHTAVA
ncbi:DUF6002 family protein [Streptomyces sp. 1331.2]|uniref:DUF6002 family protein n=1 Tax=Streptomyces sp. 1331.2 TaxID=1938835 RepID=UPI000BDD135C|nr:DUF6002 family protein [Streptomyces sp. 1331.2]SOB88715.1 hypothetical protein SAMN06272789_7007 [Streptomyces sp. 1331.2]